MTTVKLPDDTTLGLPDTGAASICTPSAAAASRSFTDVGGSMVVASTMILGRRFGSDRTPSGPVVTSITSLPLATIVKMMSRSASSMGLSTT